MARDTLRKWEQRYGVLRPTRTTGGQRRYSELDVARVEWLRARLKEGYRIGEAAELLEGASEVPREPDELREAILAAADRADAEAVGRLLDQAFSLYPLEQTLTDVVVPVGLRVGEAWAAGRLTVAQEHLVSQAMRMRLQRLLADARGGVRGVAVLACAPEEQHELGLAFLAVLLRADGWQVAYLGPATPVDDALRLARDLAARLLCISVTLPRNLAEVENGLRGDRPTGLELVLGGAGVGPGDAKRIGAHWVNGNLPKAVAGLRKLAR